MKRPSHAKGLACSRIPQLPGSPAPFFTLYTNRNTNRGPDAAAHLWPVSYHHQALLRPAPGLYARRATLLSAPGSRYQGHCWLQMAASSMPCRWASQKSRCRPAVRRTRSQQRDDLKNAAMHSVLKAQVPNLQLGFAEALLLLCSEEGSAYSLQAGLAEYT